MDLDWLFPDRVRVITNIVSDLKGDECHHIYGLEGLKKPEEWIKELEALKEMFPYEVNICISNWASGYNNRLDKLVSKYPITVDKLWQCYRRGGGIGSFLSVADKLEVADIVGTSKVLKPDFLKVFKELANEDENIAKECQYYLYDILDEGTFSLEEEPPYIVLEEAVDPLLGIKEYTFLDWNNLQSKSIWDGRSKKVPRFEFHLDFPKHL